MNCEYIVTELCIMNLLHNTKRRRALTNAHMVKWGCCPHLSGIGIVDGLQAVLQQLGNSCCLQSSPHRLPTHTTRMDELAQGVLQHA